MPVHTRRGSMPAPVWVVQQLLPVPGGLQTVRHEQGVPGVAVAAAAAVVVAAAVPPQHTVASGDLVHWHLQDPSTCRDG